jgi:hypothetical protein
MIKIFMLYVGIIAVIQEHKVIIVTEECPDMSTYIWTHWVPHLRVSRLLNMSSA